MTERIPDCGLAEEAIEQIAKATLGTPYEGRLYVVGGYLRDRRLGRGKADEVDLALEGDAVGLADFLYQRRVAAGRPITYPRFGTAMLRVNQIMVELVTARRETYEESSRKPAVEPATIAEDALRRDFTINTLFRSVHTGTEQDPTGHALEDLALGVIRTPLDPDQTFFDDPLRMMRAARFAAQLGFHLDPAASESIRRCSGRLKVISQERIRDEWTKLLLSPRPALGVALLQELGLLNRFLPELSDLASRAPLWDHTLQLLGALASGSEDPDVAEPGAQLALRLAAALHHAVSPASAAALLGRLRYSTAEARLSALLLDARERLIPRHTSPTAAHWSDGEVRQWIRRVDGHLPELFTLCRFDRAVGDAELAPVDLERFCERVNRLENEVPSASLESPLDGAAIMALLNIPPGPRVREVKDWLLDQVLEGKLAQGDQAAATKLVMDPAAAWRKYDRSIDRQSMA